MKFSGLLHILEQTYSQLSQRDRDILATLLIGEAGGEQDYIAGMAAVMNVITNRAKNDITKFIPVALQRKQFSTFNKIKTQGDMNQRILMAKKHPAYNQALSIVDSALKRTLPPVVGTSTHYYANLGTQKITPPTWTKQGNPSDQIGSHKFYTNVPYRRVK